MIGSAPCVMNAIVDGLAAYRVRHIQMPVTAEEVWRLIQLGKKSMKA